MYQHGNGVAQDYQKAKKLYEKAIELGDSYAMSNLGNMYQHGNGVIKDYQKSKDLYVKAIELGNLYAMNNLGYMYQKGNGVVQDYQKAKELYEKSIELGYSDAMNNLGYMYRYGDGVVQDYQKAKELYEKSIGLGNPSAMCNLGSMYRYGTGVKQDYQKARELYEKGIACNACENSKNIINTLIHLYRSTDLKNDISYVSNYFLSINKKDKLLEIYSAEEIVEQYFKIDQENQKLNNKIINIEKENREMKLHIDLSPDGELYIEAKKDWNGLKNLHSK